MTAVTVDRVFDKTVYCCFAKQAKRAAILRHCFACFTFTSQNVFETDGTFPKTMSKYREAVVDFTLLEKGFLTKRRTSASRNRKTGETGRKPVYECLIYFASLVFAQQ
jgi:hypothetical protein